MPRRFHLLLALLLVPLLAACATALPPETPPLTFVVVRHAEKATDDPEDPGLTAAGRARATALAERLRHAPLVAAYATEFRRTQQTAQPSAALHGLGVKGYFARGPAAEIAAQWRQAHRSGTVLVVGHSNTVPDLVAALCACTAAPMDETEYDRISIVRFAADGRASLDVQRYGAIARP
ncbi:histidine phosphatase family protein [Pseudoxanthomonas sp. F37]|uniref:histidine phosphatase family protein n=1 Tax=Pseudoxanthomonas TaxID=83618 RepID=UPI001FD35F74|nr:MULTISPECIES: histidine phosphatase family protein [Pseudoxanthomonas]UOV06019.1 histidine phosphatase family protein [Pseudoxanthomonas mexicana]UOV07606.1 histidine phosphatase family protein [Pseudoxanthomonas sp. F37]